MICGDYLIYHYSSDTSGMEFGNCSTALSHRKLELNGQFTGQSIIIHQKWDQNFKINNNNNITRTQQVNIHVWGNGLYGDRCGATQALGVFDFLWNGSFSFSIPCQCYWKKRKSDRAVGCLFSMIWKYYSSRKTHKDLSHFTLVMAGRVTSMWSVS